MAWIILSGTKEYCWYCTWKLDQHRTQKKQKIQKTEKKKDHEIQKIEKKKDQKVQKKEQKVQKKDQKVQKKERRQKNQTSVLHFQKRIRRQEGHESDKEKDQNIFSKG